MILLRNFLLTLFIESAVALAFHVRKKKALLIFAGINLLTNLPAQLLVKKALRLFPMGIGFQTAALLLEGCIVLIEAALLKRFVKGLPVHPLELSLFANLQSMLVGMVLQVML